MSTALAFLTTLSDRELTYLHAYKYATYLEHSRAVVDAELERRQLDAVRRNVLLAEPFSRTWENCPRCGCERFLYETVEKWRLKHYEELDALGGRRIQTINSECVICGLVLHDGNSGASLWQRFWQRLFRLWGWF